ncbi:uncharacterized protein LOC108834993 isoform X2 [Raphanus sativus]|uniref:Uncharacterized protein LOC108834993 isoform X2 n=1 Tax=Raphanus sativus TaxID=3726 RepID=A0A9W3CDF0_RAPSA|nr:uncharacterized protein LOC108834993 isoform X2 [Raphanus sativus]
MIRSFQFRAPTNHPGSSIKTDHSHRLIRFPTRCSSPDLGHYTVLGLTPFASQAEVKRAFKRLALKIAVPSRCAKGTGEGFQGDHISLRVFDAKVWESRRRTRGDYRIG